MRYVLIVLALLAGVMSTTTVVARGGQSADDCPPGNRDPDCKK
jgi:hypothetical protein